MDFTRLSQKTDAYFFASGGEAEPSPPWQSCPGCTFTQPPPPRFGMEPPRPTDFSPRASIFASASSFSRLPPSARCPPRPGGQHLASVSGKDNITEAHRWMGRPRPSSGIARGGWHVRPCNQVYVAQVSMLCRIPARRRVYGQYCVRCIDTGPFRDFSCAHDGDFSQGDTYADSHPRDVAFERGRRSVHQAGRRCGGGAEKGLTTNGEPFVALIDTRKLDYYRALEAEHRQPLVLSDIAKGLEDVPFRPRAFGDSIARIS